MKFNITGDSCSDAETLLLCPTWADTTSEAPFEVKSRPMQGVRDRVEVLANVMLMGRFLSRIKNTGRVSVIKSNGHVR